MKSLLIYLAALALFLAACSSRDARNERLGDADTSVVGETQPGAGNQVSRLEGAPTGGPSRLLERTVIGLLEHGAEDWFGDIRAIAVDRLGRVYVADTYTTDVRVFDSAGAYVRTLGRRGQGPGEFIWPSGLIWQNDSTLWVLDNSGNHRYSAYDTSGAHIRDRRRLPLGAEFYYWHARFDGAMLIESWIRAGGRSRLAAIDPEAPFGSPEVPLGAPQDTFPYALAGVPSNEWSPMVYVRSGTTVRGMKVPFTEGFEWSLDGRGAVWVGDTRTGRLVRRSLAGDTLLVVTHHVPGAPVSDEERRTAIEALGPGASELDRSRIPDRKPVFRIIIPSDDGGVWLVREGEGPTWFVDMLDADGQMVGSAELPVEPDLKVFPVVTGSDFWVVTRGALDVHFVVRFTAQ